MKIQQILGSMGVALNNEEKDFVADHGEEITLTVLDEHGLWIAQNLVRKGIYEISNDDKTLIKAKNVFHLRSSS